MYHVNPNKALLSITFLRGKVCITAICLKLVNSWFEIYCEVVYYYFVKIESLALLSPLTHTSSM